MAKKNARNRAPAIQICFEASKPDRGSFVSFDSEGQSQIVINAAANQRPEVEKLLNIPYGKTFPVAFASKGNQDVSTR